jgi:vacuolar-type H+-ATPase subunit C/Vma6
MTDFVAAGARARGLRAHLFTRAELEKLAAEDSLGRGLARTGKLVAAPADAAPTQELEGAIRLTAKHHLATLARWEGAAPVIEVFSAEQDRRSLRALLRGAQQAAPSDRRLAGLLPTSTLPERLLCDLARLPTPAAIVSHLVSVDHPDAGRLFLLTHQKAQPDLFAVDVALVQAFGARSRRGEGDEPLRRFIAHRLDVSNAQTAVMLEGARDVDADTCFVEGGSSLTREAFLELARARLTDAGAILRRALSGTPLSKLGEGLVDGLTLERTGFCLLLDEQRRAAREHPLSSAPALAFLLLLDAMLRDLRRIVWGLALGAPPGLIRPELVTPWS